QSSGQPPGYSKEKIYYFIMKTSGFHSFLFYRGCLKSHVQQSDSLKNKAYGSNRSVNPPVLPPAGGQALLPRIARDRQGGTLGLRSIPGCHKGTFEVPLGAVTACRR